VPLCAMEFFRVSVANLRLAQRSVPPIAAGRQRLVGMKRYRAFCHLMPRVHEVKNTLSRGCLNEGFKQVFAFPEISTGHKRRAT
jgi:hypothetical protein